MSPFKSNAMKFLSICIGVSFILTCIISVFPTSLGKIFFFLDDLMKLEFLKILATAKTTSSRTDRSTPMQLIESSMRSLILETERKNSL